MAVAIELTGMANYKCIEEMDKSLLHLSNQIRLMDQKITTTIENEIVYDYDNQYKNIQELKAMINKFE
ncbi:hypothetical protein ACLIBG_07805 [Virgibacillus sp. W0181]|uniref:hypothetical protein n=1 Tax=Virgibacillus sp. W0181 TaxID=3391581 RepID=UPI003F44A3DA